MHLTACASSEPPGQLLLAFQTDMHVPKDVDLIRVEVMIFGRIHFERDYAVGDGEVRLPATLGILGGKDPSMPVTIRIISRQEGRVRTLREIVTTVPEDRVATLRVPIQWLCDGSGEERGNEVINTCPDGLMCIAGQCVSRNVDSTTLPDYQPELVFGGARGPGESGECLDTVGCFALGGRLPLDPATCPGPLPTTGLGVNVALVKAALSRGNSWPGRPDLRSARLLLRPRQRLRQ